MPTQVEDSHTPTWDEVIGLVGIVGDGSDTLTVEVHDHDGGLLDSSDFLGQLSVGGADLKALLDSVKGPRGTHAAVSTRRVPPPPPPPPPKPGRQ